MQRLGIQQKCNSMWASMGLGEIHAVAVLWSSSPGLTQGRSSQSCHASIPETTSRMKQRPGRPVTSWLPTVEYGLKAQATEVTEPWTEVCVAQSIQHSSLAWSCQRSYTPWSMPINEWMMCGYPVWHSEWRVQKSRSRDSRPDGDVSYDQTQC